MNLLFMKIREAYEAGKKITEPGRTELADKIWIFKHPDIPTPDPLDREYVSWAQSTPHILEAAVKAGLQNLDVIFELPTPIGGYIDVTIVGSQSDSPQERGRILIVELKQWNAITKLADKDYVRISVGRGETSIRRHPVSQIVEYNEHMRNSHHGIYKDGHIGIKTIAYLHNFENKTDLFDGAYSCWNEYEDSIYVKDEQERLEEYLSATFNGAADHSILEVVDDGGFIMGEAGFSGLKKAISGEENAQMVKDQMSIVDYVRGQMAKQKTNPHPEIIVISGGPGTGKTIIGMHLLYDYAEIFNNKANAEGAVFCLPRSKTVQTMINYECGEGTVPFMDRIGKNQNLVVVDESHRITDITGDLDKLFDKGTKLLVLLQDDHQRIRPKENGTYENIIKYAQTKHIEYNAKPLTLTIQKRCEALGTLLAGLENMFYRNRVHTENDISSVRIFDKLIDMDEWITELAKNSRAKLIAPFCWEWNKARDTSIKDVNIPAESFAKAWNPMTPEAQRKWYYGSNMSDLVACIYTCQGLDLDDVGFIWWDDLRWDNTEHKWIADESLSKDFAFSANNIRGLSQDEITELLINTYYVMLSRARNKMGIWFKDEATKQHVAEYLGLKKYDASDEDFKAADEKSTVIDIQTSQTETDGVLSGKIKFVDKDKKYAYVVGDNGEDYCISEKTIEFMGSNADNVLIKGNRISFKVWTSSTGKKYANNVRPE